MRPDHRSVRRLTLGGAVLALCVLLLGCPPPGLPGHYAVTSEADAHDMNPGDGLCRALIAAGTFGTFGCTLRAAVEEANQHTGLALIMVPAGDYVLSLGEIAVAADMAIRGAGVPATTVDAQDASRIFLVEGGIVTLEAMRLRTANPRTGPVPK